MRLKITDYIWAVGHKTRKVKTVYAPLKVGVIEGVDALCPWQIDEVGKDTATVSVIRHDGVKIKTFHVEKGKEEYWRPLAMDAGHAYKIKLVFLF